MFGAESQRVDGSGSSAGSSRRTDAFEKHMQGPNLVECRKDMAELMAKPAHEISLPGSMAGQQLPNSLRERGLPYGLHEEAKDAQPSIVWHLENIAGKNPQYLSCSEFSTLDDHRDDTADDFTDHIEGVFIVPLQIFRVPSHREHWQERIYNKFCIS